MRWVWVEHRGLLAVLVAFLVLGTVYSVVTPIFEASDELRHYPFVRHLALGGGLPVQDPANEAAWKQEGSQPPLYYALGALATFWIDTSDFERVWRLNPHALVGVPGAEGNLNMIVHTGREAFPWRGTALAVHIVRLLSVLMGAVTVLCTYLIALALWPDGKGLAVGAAAFNAFLPMFLFISASVNNDNLVVALSSLALLMMVRMGRETRFFGKTWFLGLVVGLAALSKASALGLLPLALLAVAVAAWQTSEVSGDFGSLGRRARLIIAHCSLLILTVAAVAGWWYARNWVLYHDPLGLNTFVAIVGPRVPRPTLRQLLPEWNGFVAAFWGLFGGVNVPMSPWVYRLLNAVALLGVAGLPLAAFRSRFTNRSSQSATRNRQLAILSLWPVVIFAALVRWTSVTPASQGRLMFPAISAIAVLLVWGWSGWLPRRYGALPGWAVGVGMLALAAAAPFAYIAPAYARPPLLAESDLARVPHRLDVTFGGRMRLWGYDTDADTVRPGDRVRLTLYWQAVAPMERDYSVFVHLLDEADLVIAQGDSYPGRGNFPTSAWRVGEAIADTYELTVSSTAFAPGAARFEVGLYDFATGQRLAVADSDGRPRGDNVRFHRVAVASPGGAVPNPVRFNFEDKLALIGYDLDRRVVEPGGTVRLTLYWQALAPMERDYTVFTHVIGADGRRWAQKDSQPRGGSAPTSAWQPGQTVADEYRLVLAPDTPPGVCDVVVGLYLASSGDRLGVLDEGGRLRSDWLLLTRLRVAPAP